MFQAKTLQIMKNFRKFSTIGTINNEISPNFTNRNPRNLERMRIGYKPDGYHLEKPGKCYWHQLRLNVTGRYITATINHFANGEVIKASTSEWSIKKQLYRCTDTSAYINLARILADRCLKSGIEEINCNIEPKTTDGKIAKFLSTMTECGVRLEEPTQYRKPNPWDKLREDKPWNVVD